MRCRHDFRQNLVTGYWQCVKCDEPGHPIYVHSYLRVLARSNRPILKGGSKVIEEFVTDVLKGG